MCQGIGLHWGGLVSSPWCVFTVRVNKRPAGKGRKSNLFSCTTLVRDGAGPVPADYKQDLILQALMGLSKSTCANGLIKLKPVYVTNLHKEKLEPRLD